MDHLGEEGIKEMFTVLSENLPENTKSGLKKKSRKPVANPEVTKLKKEQQKLERAMERLKRLYMYSEDSISEQEYITERNRIDVYKRQSSNCSTVMFVVESRPILLQMYFTTAFPFFFP